ncbi:MAG: helix-turn-helix domain-containing protein [Anaerolineae bacterium]|nr:helix-turn-helix domain-containing protein [Anaerolineae bacterium]
MPEFLSIKDVADYLGVEYKTVYRLVRKAAIPAAKVGGVYRIRKEDVDAYLKRQMQEVEPEKGKTSGKALKCGFCFRLLADDSEIGGFCEAAGCEAVIGMRCWQDEGVRHCLVHRPTQADLLAQAQARFAAGEIPVLVTALEARQRERAFLTRFDYKVQRIAKLQHPISGDLLQPPSSWPDLCTTWDESERLMAMRRTGYLEREVAEGMPLNRTVRYTIPAKGSRPGLILEGRVFSHLALLLKQGFDTRPASYSELLSVLDECIEQAEAGSMTCLIGVAATSGWAAEAREYVGGRDFGRGFYHPHVIPVLVDLETMGVHYNDTDQRVTPLLSLFKPLLPHEEVGRVIEYVEQELRFSRGVSVEEVWHELGVAEEYIQNAFERLAQKRAYRVENVRTVGIVITRVES